MVESIDGGGKDVVIEGLKKRDEALGKNVVDINSMWKNNVPVNDNLLLQIYGKVILDERKGRFYCDIIPTYSDLKKYYIKHYNKMIDSIIVSEPTFGSFGLKIRTKIVDLKKGDDFTPKQEAEAYAADRHELLQKLIIPAIDDGVNVYSARGFISSVVYQSQRNENALTINKIMSIPGNIFARKNHPELVIIVDIKPEIAVERLAKRDTEQTKFEKISFLEPFQKFYMSDFLKSFLEEMGCKVVYFDNNRNRDLGEVYDAIKRLMDDFYGSKKNAETKKSNLLNWYLT